MMKWMRSEVVVCNNLIESEDNLIDSEGKKMAQKSMTYGNKKHHIRDSPMPLKSLIFEGSLCP